MGEMEKRTFPARKRGWERNSKPTEFGEVQSAQLHTMSDASTTGYGQCSYLRLVDEHGTVHVSFQGPVVSKAFNVNGV